MTAYTGPYIAANMEASTIKIGKATKTSFKARLSVLQSGSCQRLTLLCRIISPYSDRETERMVHDFYSEYKIPNIGTREWFNIEPDLDRIRKDLRTLGMDAVEVNLTKGRSTRQEKSTIPKTVPDQKSSVKTSNSSSPFYELSQWRGRNYGYGYPVCRLGHKVELGQQSCSTC